MFLSGFAVTTATTTGPSSWLLSQGVSKFDWTIVRTAATGGLIIIVPGAIGSGLLFEDGPTGLVWLFFAIVLAGFGVAGYIAGRLRTDTPLAHGAISALLAFAVAQLFGIVTSLTRGDGISWIAIPLTALLALSMGVAGALLSDVAHRRSTGAAQS